MFSKKSQVTIFIIAAIVLLAVGGVSYYYVTEIKAKEEQPKVLIAQKVPVEFEPVKSYITNCLYRTAEEALVKIGETGGYVSIDTPSLNGNANIGRAFVSFTPDSQHKVVYWRYYDGNKIDSKMPPLRKSEEGTMNKKGQSIESQIEKYVETEIDTCLDSFKPFEGFTFTPKGKRKAAVTVAESDVAVQLDFPLEVSRQNSIVEMKQFFASVPLNFKKIYELAKQIRAIEDTDNFLEKYANLIISLTTGDNPRPPPKYDVFFSYTPKIWINHNVESEFKKIVEQQFTQIQIVKEDANIRDPFPNGILVTLIGPAASLIDGTDVSFKALPEIWPFKFDICGRQLCKSASCSGALPVFPCQRINFNYNIEFPVLVEITQQNALNQKPYRFRYFLQSVIKDNYPVGEGLSSPPSITAFSSVSQLCDATTWGSDEITIRVVNLTSTPTNVEGALISYTVIGRENCLLGQTNEKGELKTTMPSGTAFGALTAEMADMISKTVNYDAGHSSPNEVEIQLIPTVPKKFSVKKRVYKKIGNWFLDSFSQDLNDNEKALVTLKRVAKDRDGNINYSVFAEFQGGTRGASPHDFPTINIAEGEYEADIQLILSDVVKIPKSKRKFGGVNLGIATLGEKEVEIPEINFGIAPEGNLHIAKLDKVSSGSHSYKIKCVDKSLVKDINNPPPNIFTHFGPVSINANPATGSLNIQSVGITSFKSREAYLAVETGREAECRYRDMTNPNKAKVNPNVIISPPDKPERYGYEEYNKVDTSSLLHIAHLNLQAGQSKFEVICREKNLPNAEWDIGPEIILDVADDYALNDKQPENPITVSSLTPNSFASHEALIAVETDQYTSCYYAELKHDGSNPSDSDYIAMGIEKDSQFIEGGFKGKINIKSTEDFDEIIFFALDMGVDDIAQQARTIEDLEQLSNVEEKSQHASSWLQPDYNK